MHASPDDDSNETASARGCLFHLMLGCNGMTSLAAVGLWLLSGTDINHESGQWIFACLSALSLLLLIVQLTVCLPFSLVAAMFQAKGRIWLDGVVLLILLVPGIVAGFMMMRLSPT